MHTLVEIPVQCRLTKRALDAGESARFIGIFSAATCFSLDGVPPSAPAQVTHTVGQFSKGFDNLMKLLSAFVSTSIIFGCGILSVIFGLPERYIERDITPEEMVGTWNITSDSEADVR